MTWFWHNLETLITFSLLKDNLPYPFKTVTSIREKKWNFKGNF